MSASAPRATLSERDAHVIARIGKLRFSPSSLIGGRGNRLIEEGGRELLDLGLGLVPPSWVTTTRPLRRR